MNEEPSTSETTTKATTLPPSESTIATEDVRKLYVQLKLQNPLKIKAPSLRNREIFHAVKIDQRTLRDVGKQFKLSHPRILVICRQFERWLGDTVGRGDQGNWMQRKGVAEYLHRERLHHLYGKAMELLELSQRDQRSEKLIEIEGKPNRKETVVKTGKGDWRCIDMAMRAEDMRMKFDYQSGSIQPPYEDEIREKEAKQQAESLLEQAYFNRPPSEREMLEDARLRQERERIELAEREEKLKQLQLENEQRALRIQAERERQELSQSDCPQRSFPSEESVMSGTTFEEKKRVLQQAIRDAGRTVALTLEGNDETGSETKTQPSESEMKFSFRMNPIDVGKGVMVVPPKNCIGPIERQKFITEYHRRRIAEETRLKEVLHALQANHLSGG